MDTSGQVRRFHCRAHQRGRCQQHDQDATKPRTSAARHTNPSHLGYNEAVLNEQVEQTFVLGFSHAVI